MKQKLVCFLHNGLHAGPLTETGPSDAVTGNYQYSRGIAGRGIAAFVSESGSGEPV